MLSGSLLFAYYGFAGGDCRNGSDNTDRTKSSSGKRVNGDVRYIMNEKAILRPESTNHSDTTRLIIFTRYPEPGKTKTRLIPQLGADGAAALQRELTEHAVAMARCASKRIGCEIEIHVTGADPVSFSSWLGSDLACCDQEGNDLGSRMLYAFETAFAKDAERVVLIGIDCPYLKPHHLDQAFRALCFNEVVLGPALDGGYNLIGLSSPAPELFKGIAWGTDQVFERTRERIEQSGLKLALLPQLNDIDHPEDLKAWRDCEETETREEIPLISVILPALNSAATIRDSLRSVLAEPQVEAIVVDGGSVDETASIANAGGASVLMTPCSRAIQMNAGVRIATSDIFLFLHSDTILPCGWAEEVKERLARDSTCLGAFELGIDAKGFSFRIIEWLANLRSRWLSRPYGDQALFLTRSRFDILGCYPEQPFLEDLDLVAKAHRTGRVLITPKRVLTSACRWQTVGVLRSILLNQVILACHRLGQPIEKLEKMYRSGRFLC